jgi:Tfp pilus assembly protein PilF
VRISVQLVKVADGYHMWSETYDRTLDDIFAVQDDIAQSVVKELRAKLLGEEADSKASGEVKAEVSKAAKGRATNPEAYRLYLQGRQLTERLNPEDMTRGIQYIEQALGLDREFPNAWAVLAWAYLQAANLGLRSLDEARLRAREAVERALELEQNLADAHAVLAHICITEWDWRGAEVSLKRALELAPGNAVVLRRAGVLATHQGRFAEAIQFLSLGLDQDPLSSSIYHNLGWAHRDAGQPAAAEQALRKALELAPQRVGTRAFLAMALRDQGRGEEALAEAMREPFEVFRLWALAMIQHALGHPTESSQALEKLIETFREDAPFQVAEVYGDRGEADAAIKWLERAYTARDPGLSEAKISPELRSLHGDPRWAALVRKLGFEE